ncbi:thioredoxin family protein [Pelagicoccus mobilis]|uniref:Thioredoxin family protein n=1 Tax=Pelagicoccus mobilis TaxID=415221 RepID=A0A934S0T5_9BACT|nr:thioredoxin family protein [Pelagicoccus mobilis]MBK1878909.1 thioredoxin family protein [Pelagicoccus mobilis]
MKLRIRLFGVVLAALFCGAFAQAVTVGEKAPGFSLTDVEGKTHSLKDYEGKVVVLEWTNHGCPYVSKFYRSGKMQEFQGIAAGKDVVWLSICSSAEGKQGHMSSSEWRQANARKGVKASAVLLDEMGKVGKAYGARATPHMFVIDDKGVLAYDGAIDSIPSTSPADIDRAENYVLAAVDALLEGRPVEKSKVRPYGCGIKWAR